jgi:DNA-binding PadR family transcriptional regulator
MSRSKYGRHTPAFILLFLAKEPAYGSLLLTKMEEELPFNLIDGPSLYRSLHDLEKEQAVESYWDTSDPGPAKKWYRITPTGREKLEEFRQDIEMRKKNLEYFLNTFRKL